MYAEILKVTFDKYYNAPIEIWKYFSDLCEKVDYEKNEIVKSAHTIEKYGYFLLKGSCGLFVSKENDFVCADLFLENSFFADDVSLLSGKSSPIEIMALEKSSLLRIKKAAIEDLKNTPIGSVLFMAGEQNANVEKQKQQIELLTKTAEERYRYLLKNQSELLQRIHQKHIASYLGITTQSLSRIRRKIR